MGNTATYVGKKGVGAPWRRVAAAPSVRWYNDAMQEIRCNSLEELGACALRVVQCVPAYNDHATVLGLSGDLGAGKTAFTKLLAEHLGVTEHVTSPTFVIQKNYATTDTRFTTLVHIDAYRLASGQELAPLRWQETCATPNTLIIIEWPEQVRDALPDDTITLSFAVTGDTERTITLPDNLQCV